MKIYSFLLLSENADVSLLSRKNARLPPFFFLDCNSPYEDLLFPRGLQLAQKPLYLVDSVLKVESRVQQVQLSPV